jgi:hypothetical protein
MIRFAIKRSDEGRFESQDFGSKYRLTDHEKLELRTAVCFSHPPPAVETIRGIESL